MLSQSEKRMIVEMSANKELYLEFLEESSARDPLRETKELYRKMDILYSTCLSSSGDEALSRSAFQDSLRSKKIDPFIAGGVSQSIGGFFTGAYTALEMDSYNRRIEAKRNTLKKMAEADSAERSAAEIRLRPVIHRLDEILDSNSYIKHYRDDLREDDYRKAISLKSEKSYIRAAELFLSLGEYKDSEEMAELCNRKSITDAICLLIIISTVLSIIIVFISGVFLSGIKASLIVFMIAFAIWIIAFLIMSLRRRG